MINNENILSHKVIKGDKLYNYLKDELFLSLRLTNSIIKSNNLLVNDKIVKKNIMLNKDDIITLIFEDEINEYEKENIPLEILYETKDLLVINKQPNIIIHPTKNVISHTIANGVAYYFDNINLKRKIRFVNRLDMDTSGILVIAKNAYSHGFLAKQFDSDTVSKKYLTIIDGHLKEKSGVIESSIAKDNEKYHVDDNGKMSKTIYKVIKEYKDYSLVECELKSGRTHQIRIHLSSIGGFILGDSFYHEESNLINRQALHAYELTFIEPRTFNKKTIKCELPFDMKNLLL